MIRSVSMISALKPSILKGSNQTGHRGPLAQWLEQRTHNPLVAGSSPAGPTIPRASGSGGRSRPSRPPRGPGLPPGGGVGRDSPQAFRQGGHLACLASGLAAAGLVALTPLGWGQSGDFTLDLAYQQDRAVDRVIARADPAADNWNGERDYAAIDSELKKVARDLISDPQSSGPLKQWTNRFGKLELAEFKIVSIRREPSDRDLVRVAARVEFGGTAPAGSLLSLVGSARMAWVIAAGEWAMRTVEGEDIRETSAERRGFVEVTQRAFGRIESFQSQLSVDLDSWRDAVDAALGISVYGHQGVSLGDVDGDGLEDLYVSQPAGLPNRLYRNNGNGTFSDRTAAAGLDVLDDTSMSLFADLDNDGDQDLVLIGTNPMLFRNRGDGHFAFDAASGLDVPDDRAAMFTGAALADYDLDGDLDLYVCAYDFWRAGAEYDAPAPFYDAVNGPANLLFRNDGRGVFEEVSRSTGMASSNDRFSFAAAWGDFDDDGDPDLYVANDFGRNNLYVNNGDGTFDDRAAEFGVEDLGAGMSVAWGDYDNDGDLDLYIGNMWSSAGLRLTGSEDFDRVASSAERRLFRRQAQGNSLFRNDGTEGFADVSERAGVRRARWAWASDFVDLDSDGLLDLLVLNGFVTGKRTDDL